MEILGCFLLLEASHSSSQTECKTTYLSASRRGHIGMWIRLRHAPAKTINQLLVVDLNPKPYSGTGREEGPVRKEPYSFRQLHFSWLGLRILMDHDARLVYRGVAGVLERKC